MVSDGYLGGGGTPEVEVPQRSRYPGGGGTPEVTAPQRSFGRHMAKEDQNEEKVGV